MDPTVKEERLRKRRARESYAGNMSYALPPVGLVCVTVADACMPQLLYSPICTSQVHACPMQHFRLSLYTEDDRSKTAHDSCPIMSSY